MANFGGNQEILGLKKLFGDFENFSFHKQGANNEQREITWGFW